MANDLDALVVEFYDYFLGLYKQERSADAVATDPFLAFMPMGMPVSPVEFKSPADGSLSPQLMTEWLSGMANKVPDIDGTTFMPTLRTVDGHYELLFVGARALPDTDATLFERLKSDAARLYEQGELGTSQVGFDFTFRPVLASPANWGDPSASGIWVAKSFSMSASSTTTPPPGPTPRPGMGWRWKVLKPGVGIPAIETPGINPRADIPVLRGPVLRGPVLHGPVLHGPVFRDEVAVRPRPVSAMRLSAMAQPVALTPLRSAGTDAAAGVATRTINTDAAALAMAGRPTAIKDQRLERAVAARAKLDGVAPDTGAAIAEKTPMVVRPDLFVRHDLVLASQLELVQGTTPKKIETTDVALSFEYCLVSFSRTWMSPAFLSSRGWYVPGFAAGEFSTGSAGGPESEDALLEALPTAALVVRNLRITADFSREDTKVLRDAASFGPFSLIGRETLEISSSITCPGMQIVAWVCEPLPKLPPASDPALG